MFSNPEGRDFFLDSCIYVKFLQCIKCRESNKNVYSNLFLDFFTHELLFLTDKQSWQVFNTKFNLSILTQPIITTYQKKICAEVCM